MKTLLIDLETTRPQYNLAAEEYFLKKDSRAKLILWQNEPSVIIGRNQNTLAEINKEAVDELGVHVVRRMSGGGAVFHDLGNLNYTFITKNDGNDFMNFKKFTDPIIDVLGGLGVEATLSGRNDLLIDGRKFSGNAQYVYKDMLLHHGTLMFKVSTDILEKVLAVNEMKIKTKGIASVKSRVTNISEHSDISIPEFKRLVFDAADGEKYVPSEEDIAEIKKLEAEKYGTWEWNYGFSPKYSYKNAAHFPCGIVELNMDIKNGIIEKVLFSGDFFGKKDVAPVSEALCGVHHEEKEIRKTLEKFPIFEYFAGLSADDLIILF